MHLQERTMCELLRAADSRPVDTLPRVLEEVLARLGARRVVLYLSDYDETLLRPVPGSKSLQGGAKTLDIDSSGPGRAYLARRLVEEQSAGITTLWVPVQERAEPFGVLELAVAHPDDDLRTTASEIGTLVGHLLVTARKYTDVYELLRRRREMNLAAEMHWDVLPARRYIGPTLSICADLEPAYEVGGDAFDYSLNHRALDVAILDAMGHGLEAALLGTQAVSAYRYGRRRQLPVEQIVRIVDDALIEQFRGERFVTGVFGRLDTASGWFRWVNAGHAAPVLLRGGRVHDVLESEVSCPLGLELLGDAPASDYRVLEGDCLFFYSDGVVEAKDKEGNHFTQDRLVTSVEEHILSGEPVGTLVHRVIADVMRHSAGPLQDDATVLVVELLSSSDVAGEAQA